MTDHPYMPLVRVLRLEPEAAHFRVSEIARGPHGFLEAYKRVGGDPSRLGQRWKRKRAGFIARALPQFRSDPTRKRALALAMWAFDTGWSWTVA